MHLFVSVLAIVLVTCHGFVLDTVDKPIVYNASPYGGELVGMLNKFKDVLKHGDKNLSIPVLDPFYQEHMDVNVDKKELVLVQGTLDDVRESGLSEYDVLRGDFTLAGLKINVSLLWDKIDIATKYNAKGKLLDSISFFGNGNLDIDVRGLNVSVDMKMGIRDGKMYVQNLEFRAHLKEFNIKITGLLDDEEISNILSKAFTEIIPGLIDDYETELSNIVNPIATDLLNNILKNYTLKDLLEMINGD